MKTRGRRMLTDDGVIRISTFSQILKVGQNVGYDSLLLYNRAPYLP